MRSWSSRLAVLGALVLLVLVLSPNLFLASAGSDFAGHGALNRARFVVFSALLVLLPLLVVPLRLYALLLLPAFFLAPVELAHMQLFGGPSTVGAIGSMVDTDLREASEFVSDWAGLALLWIVAVVLALIPTLRARNLAVSRVAILGLCAAFALAFLGRELLKSGSLSEAGASVAERLGEEFDDSYPFGTVVKAASVYPGWARLRQHEQMVRDFRFGAKKRRPLAEREIYVMVIGENARYANWSVNGYARPTSPRLERLPGLISFADVASCAGFTKISVPVLLTRASPRNMDLQYTERSFLAAFREAGFEAWWLSNQTRFGSIDTPVSAHAIDASYANFTNADFHQENRFDGALLPELDRLLAQDEQKVVLLIHTLGSHWKYENRYPKEFEAFTPTETPGFGASFSDPDFQRAKINAYDNTILYTDFVLASIIERLEATGAVSNLLYISDHGENLFDDERMYFLHGAHEPTRVEMHVPLFVWYSPAYARAFPERTATLLRNRERPLSSENVFHTFIDMADLHIDGEDLSRSFASDEFSERPRVVRTPDDHLIGYDELR